MSSGRRTSDALEGLLTVDFASQLRKTLAHSHSFPQQYAVECVRWCLAGGAQRIVIVSSSRELVVKWEGGQAQAVDLDALSELFGPDRSWERREAALERFHGVPGLGLLAAWACNPSSVVMHLDTASGSVSLEYSPERFGVTSHAGPSSAGNGMQSMRIVRKADAKAEAAAVTEYCRFAPVSITLNGAELCVGSLPPEGIAGFKLKNDKGEGFGLLWVPRRGDLCRLILLRHGVRWKMVATATHRKGLVYEGAVQAEAVSSALMHTLDGAGRKLYTRLAESVDQMPAADKARTEHLLLNYSRITGETKLLEQAKLFPLADGSAYLSLSDLREAVAGGSVAAVAVGMSVPKNENVNGVLVRLTDAQATFLREMGVDVPTLRKRTMPGGGVLLARLADGTRNLWSRLSAGAVIPSERQTGLERSLLGHIEEAVRSGAFVPWGLKGDVLVRVSLRTGRGKSMLQSGPDGDELVIRRGSSRLRRAIRWNEAGAPPRLWIPWLLEGHGIWPQQLVAEESGTTAAEPLVAPDAPTQKLQ